MAGKKKAKVDDAPQSKTARASMAKKGKVEGFIPAAPEHLDRVVSLGNGSHIYLRDPRDGKSHHLAVGSDKYNEIVHNIIAAQAVGKHVEIELISKGFPVPTVVENEG